MANVLCLAGAGSGKTHKVIIESIDEIKRGGKVLVVTYTTSNQQELRARFIKEFGRVSDRFVVKGLFSFYLEDMIRPYQQAFFKRRIDGIFFNDSNPHLNPETHRPLPGRKEFLPDKSLNQKYYLTKCGTKAHSGLLAKLATSIAKVTKNAPAIRLSNIYTRVYFDEVQDLVGWDYSALKTLNQVMKSSITCVGDFRQTIYETSFGNKAPNTAEQKIAEFKKLSFIEEPLALNRRCIQPICDIADAVHHGSYEETQSAVDFVPHEFRQHLGVFIVKESEVSDYIAEFNPMVLRWSVTSGKKLFPADTRCYTFGRSKGLGFDRVLILPGEKQMKFVLGCAVPFAGISEAVQNKMYVAITRARYSLGFIVPDKSAIGLRFPLWTKAVK